MYMCFRFQLGKKIGMEGRVNLFSKILYGIYDSVKLCASCQYACISSIFKIKCLPVGEKPR